MGLQAGKLKDRIALERATSGLDDYGGENGGWIELTRVSAQFMPGTGQERRQAAQEQASAPATFRVRRSSVTRALTAKDRIRFNPAVPLPSGILAADFPAWDIVSVVPLARDGIDITAVLAV
jgi:head-tail adaptor